MNIPEPPDAAQLILTEPEAKPMPEFPTMRVELDAQTAVVFGLN